MKRRVICLCGLAVGVMCILGMSATPALANPVPMENHFKVYEVPNGPMVSFPVTLIDQFLGEDVFVTRLEKFATPVEKNGEPMPDPRSHRSWWRIQSTGPVIEGYVDAMDQFGDGRWTIRGAEYLLNPALKNEFGPPPFGQHYKCYRAVAGPVISQVVHLVDQFESVQVMVMEAMWYCNPTEKIDPAGIHYPIIDPFMHLACYRVDNPNFVPRQVTFSDQFLEGPIVLEENTCLCVPSFKEHVIDNESSSWGRIKALYDNEL